MKVIIQESGESKTLSIIDARTGVDYIADFVADGLSDFLVDEESGEYSCDTATFSWWEKVCADHAALDARIQALISEHGQYEVQGVVDGAGSVDLEYQAATVNQALDEAFGAEA